MTTPEKKKRRGRPPIDNPATSRLPVVQVTPDQLVKFRAAAENNEQSFSQWVRDSLEKAAITPDTS
jgi:hypothetical protein